MYALHALTTHLPRVRLNLFRVVVFAFALAYGGGLWLHLLHQADGAIELNAPPPLVHWLRDSTLMLPLVVVSIILALILVEKILERTARVHESSQPASDALIVAFIALVTSIATGAASPIHNLLFDAQHHLGDEEMPVVFHIFYDGALALIANVLITVTVMALSRVELAPIQTVTHHFARRAFSALMLAALMLETFPQSALPIASAAPGVCATATRTIKYEVAAFQTLIPMNGWGDHIPDGYMYALSNADAIPNKDAILANPNLAEPLVLRAAVGDCIVITFRNDIPGKRVGMHVDGISRDPKDSDGAHIGFNPDTTVPAGATITYTWFAHREGQFPINDYGSGTNFQLYANGAIQQDTTSKGLYGGLVVLPKGAVWRDPRTGRNLLNATNRGIGALPYVDVILPGSAKDYRDFALVLMDEPEGIVDRDGSEPTFPTTGLPDATFGFNYRSEPLRNRLRAVLEHRGQAYDPNARQWVAVAPKTVTLPNGTVIQPSDHFCDGYVPELGRVVADPGAQCLGEEMHLQSWPFGDQGKLTHKLADGTLVTDTDGLIPKAYRGDPVHMRLIHPGIQETHPFHQHTNRWFLEPNDPDSPRLDVQSVSPGQTFELVFEGGAGEAVSGTQATVGDMIFHCHLYPHFAQGFWGDLRVFDRLRSGNQKYPDGTLIEPLKELPDRVGVIPAPDAQHPGFPLFVKGDYLQKTYRPPYAVVNDPFQFGPDGQTANYRRPGDTIRTGTDLERANMQGGLKPGQTVKPGTFFIDPCPAGVPERTYYPAAIDARITYNRAGWSDPNGKLYVEAPPGPGKTALQQADEIRQAIQAGAIQPEPFTIRSRIGECVNLRTTNATHLDNDPNYPLDHEIAPAGDAYQEVNDQSEVSTHVHLVHFDELGTDGTSVGWNYVQAPMVGQTYGYRWFVDVALRTVFFHDHQYANAHQQRGLWAAMNVEPSDATWHDPRTGAPTNGVGTIADIHTPSGPSFREFTVHYADRVPMYDAAGKPFNPPSSPDAFEDDQGGMAINYRNEPFAIRINSASVGDQAEPAYIFSSAVHGDPSTPILRAYPGDQVVIRMITGAHEEEHNFNLAGHRWLADPDDPKSSIYDTQAAMLAEYFNFEISGTGTVVRRSVSGRAGKFVREQANARFGGTIIVRSGAGGPGDYLYSSQPLNDLASGMWGILRIAGARVPDLQPLPGNPVPPAGNPWLALKPGEAINTTPPRPSNICPANAPNKLFGVALVNQKIVYNSFGDNDPNGIAYVLDNDLGLRGEPTAGTALKPLFIRANEGDCVNIAFTNLLPTSGIPVHAGDPINPGENATVTNRVNGNLVSARATWSTGNRASIHMAGLARYEITRGDGSAVGYNYNTTVAPGESTLYRYYLDTADVGIINFQNLANVRGTRHHGAWGALLVEPKGSVYLNPKDLKPLASGEAAVIKFTNAAGAARSFREFVIDFQDGLNLYDKNGNPMLDQATRGNSDAADPEDQGEKGVNYRSEPFANRLAKNPSISDVFSSVTHGDPATPLFRAYLGDPVVVRVLNSSDLPRTHSFGIFGHEWRHEMKDPKSFVVSTEGGLNTARAFNLNLIGGAGGAQKASGDYLYGDRNLFQMLSGGIWGIIRVHSASQADLKPLP